MMLLSSLISENDFQIALSKIFVNKADALALLNFMESADKDTQDRVAFLLYTENMNLYDFKDEDFALDDFDTDTMADLLNLYTAIHFRDIVVTLTLKNYKDKANMLEQVDAVYSTMTPEEKAFLASINFIGDDEIAIEEFRNLFRYEEKDASGNYIITSQLEFASSGEYLRNITKALNGENSKELLRIFNKISLGTIH